MTNKTILEKDVANYLDKNPNFFHSFPKLLNNLSIPHPKTGTEISLLEHQILRLRQQKETLTIEIDALKNIAGTNGKLLQKVYQLANLLLNAKTDQEAIDIIYNTIQQLFSIKHIALVSWDVPNKNIQGITQLGLSQNWVNTLKLELKTQQPTCGLLENDWQKGLFNTEEKMASVCLLPLGQENKIWGVLALGATSNRFSPELGTYFLSIMSNMITARLEHLFEWD